MSTQSHTLNRNTIFIAALFAGLIQSAQAATLTWPNLNSFGACRATLQACIDGAASGDIVQIGADDLLFPDRYTTVDEDISITKSLTLRAAQGIDAVFVAGRGISVATPPAPAVAYTIAVEGLILDRGTIQVDDQAPLASVYRIERVRFNDVLTTPQCAIGAAARFPGTTPNFQIFRNVIRVRHETDPKFGVCLSAVGSSWQAYVSGNRFEAPAGGLRTAISVISAAAGPVNISNNSIVGREMALGIGIQQTTFPVPAHALMQIVDNSISGQNSPLTDSGGGIELLLSDADAQVINNSIVDGLRGLTIDSFATSPPVTGLVANNLVAYNRNQGLVITSRVPAISNRNNLVFANASNDFTPGTGTLTSDPQLISLVYPRPRDSSPAINSGSNSALPAFNGFDADGQPRILLATIDIGAYEAGYGLTGVHSTNASNALFNQTDLFALSGEALTASSILVVTALRTTAAAAALTQNIGVWLPSGIGNLPLSIFHEDASVSMPLGRRFAVTVPGFGLSGYTHLTSLGNISAQYTTLSNSALDGHPDAIGVATHNYRDIGPYHNFAIGMEYIGTHWNLRNEDFSNDMQSGRQFNIVVAPPFSENAFRVAVPASGPVAEIMLTHPLLDNNACAAPIVGRVDVPGVPTVFNATPFTLDYRVGIAGGPGRWFVVAETPTSATFPANAAFNVILDGAQANGCRATVNDTLFKDGFD